VIPAALDLPPIRRGDVYEYGLEFYTDDSFVSRRDVSGVTFASQFRRFSDAVDYVPFELDMTDATDGLVVLRLAAAVTAGLAAHRYYWDVQDMDADVTVAAGRVPVTKDQTRP
jgi:hypothetical protein